MSFYEKKYVQYLLIEGCKNREVSALGGKNANIRALSIKCLYDLNRALKLINWNKHKQNLYVSCAKLKSIPRFTFNTRKRSSETSKWFRYEYNDYITSYDLFFDFDKGKNDSWNDLIKEVLILKNYLDDYEVPYSVLFSGKKGMQIVIDGEYLEIESIDKGNIYPHKTIVENIKKMLDLKLLDLSNNGVNSRLRKLHYSIVGENLALPLSDTQLTNFNIADMKLNNVMKHIQLIRRGNLERNNKSIKEKKENTKNFIKLFIFK